MQINAHLGCSSPSDSVPILPFICNPLVSPLKKALSELSVAEVILLEPRLEKFREYIRPATIFYSHAQRQDPLQELWKLEHPRPQHVSALGPAERRFFWIDYFCLRQLVSDFRVDQVLELVKECGTLLADLDDGLQYLRRSFCLLELFGAVRGEANILVQTDLSKRELATELLFEKGDQRIEN